MESKWPWNMKPRVTPLYYKCTSLYNGKKESLTLILHCVESLVCVCILLIHHVCASTWCLTWYQSRRLLALLQIEWAILCLWPAYLQKFLAFLQHSEIGSSTAHLKHSEISAAVFLPHSESGFGEGAAFRRRRSIHKKEQHSEFVLKKSSSVFEERQHFPSEGFHSHFSCNFRILNSAPFWRAAGK